MQLLIVCVRDCFVIKFVDGSTKPLFETFTDRLTENKKIAEEERGRPTKQMQLYNNQSQKTTTQNY